MNGIRFDHVWKLFEGNVVVSDLTLDIREGEFLVLVGPSGCGKTTSLRMLAGLERPSHGRIWMGNKDVTDLEVGERDISMVFQSYALYPNMTVKKNLAFGPKVRKEPRQNLDKRINDVADLLGIRHLLDRAPSALSGGQRQRVALGRALIREPQLFLMDEPLSNLDAALRVQMRAELIRLHNRLESTTTVYVTHDQVEALTMGDRVAVLKDGLLLQVDTANDLYEYPETVFVGEFIGSPKMNVVPGTLDVTGGVASVTCLGVTTTLSAQLAGRLEGAAVNGPVLVGVRAHDLHLAKGRPDESGAVTGLVDITEHTGTEVFATIDVADLKVIARLPRTPLPQHGQAVQLAFNPERVLLFDPESKKSLLGRNSSRERISAR
ncbi:MAG: ABC transporter ATP-binding protein [Acidobacteria bacterium]|nr:ABC transporter ATP-binding protein [Acidobacteriota bacterium]